MPRTRNPYPAEFRDQIIALAKAGRSIESLAREFEPCVATIHGWVKQAEADDGDRPEVLTSDEREELRQLRRENRQLRQERGILSKAAAWFPIHTMARTLGVSRSGYYAHSKRKPCARSQSDAELTARIAAVHTASRQTYGAPRIHAELVDEGLAVGRKRVERLMKANGLKGISRRKFVTTTARDKRVRPAKDLVDRNFYADAPNVLWVADITYVPTWAGFLYLSVVLDAFSRKIVGWAMGHNLKAPLVIDAMNMAVKQRRPSDVIHHSDQGSQYTSVAFGLRCKEANVRPSMGSVGDCYDNAMCESFFATVECELLDRRKFATKAEARMACFEFIDGTTRLAVIRRSDTSHQQLMKGKPLKR